MPTSAYSSTIIWIVNVARTAVAILERSVTSRGTGYARSRRGSRARPTGHRAGWDIR